jgi:hypothetical protein
VTEFQSVSLRSGKVLFMISLFAPLGRDYREIEPAHCGLIVCQRDDGSSVRPVTRPSVEPSQEPSVVTPTETLPSAMPLPGLVGHDAVFAARQGFSSFGWNG